MKIYSDRTVLDLALDRVRRLFDEFDNIVVGFSGGKDSTVVLHLALQVAKEKNKLPLNVMWIDQEAEWQGTVDYATKVMTRPDVKPYWFQMPMVITNNASSYNRYNYCWKEEDKEKWIHPQHPISIKENKYGTERFHELFEAIMKVEFKDQSACYLAGVRAEESPKRFVSLTGSLVYKDITWGKRLYRKYNHYTFYPIYDWSYTDVWKFICSNNIEYNRVYNEFYRFGRPVMDMRISNLHHETAIQDLLIVQEIEPDTWNRVAARIDGASSIKHIRKNSFTVPKDLPYMFKDWEEYTLHLANNIIQEDKYRKILINKINQFKDIYNKEPISISFWKAIINTILSSDWDFTKFQNWLMSASVDTFRRFHLNPNGENKEKHIWIRSMFNSLNFLYPEEIKILTNYFQDGKNKS